MPEPKTSQPDKTPPAYTGRFAPSPTGPLHFGSLVAAMASYLDARANRGKWLLRIEDLDPPREIPGSARQIITSLEQLGFEWDEEIVYQSQRSDLYRHAVEALMQNKMAYACGCSRKDIALQAAENDSALRYPGNCREKYLTDKPGTAIRVLTSEETIAFHDRLLGKFSQNLQEETGDFVIRRKDGYFAYQLAVVIDDAEQLVTHIVRGEDLLDSTARQIYLQQLLLLAKPVYAHTPLVLDNSGNKFSKSSNHGMLLKADLPTLIDAWHFLNQTPVNSRDFDTIAGFWQWSIQHWNSGKLVKKHDG